MAGGSPLRPVWDTAPCAFHIGHCTLGIHLWQPMEMGRPRAAPRQGCPHCSGGKLGGQGGVGAIFFCLLRTDIRLLFFQGGLINFEKRRKVRALPWHQHSGVEGGGWLGASPGCASHFGVDPSPFFALMFFIFGEGDSGPSYLSPCVGLGCLWSRLGLANRSGLTASVCSRSLKSSPRSSCFSQPATTTASRRRTSSWSGSTAWSGSARLRGEREWGLGPCCRQCIGTSHRSSPAAEQ